MTMSSEFNQTFRQTLKDLFVWRRDVRHFKADTVDESLIEQLLDLACLAPSVGNSQPWRWVRVDSKEKRRVIYENFKAANEAAAGEYDDVEHAKYVQLKLQGIEDAPLQFAVYCDVQTEQGKGLGRQTMPEMLAYSTVCAIHSFWLAARAYGLGMGWVSIITPDAVNKALEVPAHWQLIGYLCVGYAQFESDTPELEKSGWQSREDACRKVLVR